MWFDIYGNGLAPAGPDKPGPAIVRFSLTNSERPLEISDASVSVYGDVQVPIRPNDPKIGIDKRRIRRGKSFQRYDSFHNEQGNHVCLGVFQLSMSLAELSESTPSLKPGTMLSELASRIGPFRCLKTFSEPIEALDLTFENNGGMLIFAKSPGQTMQRLRVNAKLQLEQ